MVPPSKKKFPKSQNKKQINYIMVKFKLQLPNSYLNPKEKM